MADDNGLIKRLTQFASDSADSKGVKLQKSNGVGIAISAVPTFLCFGILFLAYQESTAVVVALVCATLISLGLVSYHFYQNFSLHWTLFMVTTYMGVTWIHASLGGFSASGFIMVWTLAPPVYTRIVRNIDLAKRWAFVSIGLIISLAWGESYFATRGHFPAGLNSVLTVINLLSFAGYVFGTVFAYASRVDSIGKKIVAEREARLQESALHLSQIHAEQARTTVMLHQNQELLQKNQEILHKNQELLHNMLPVEIANELSATGSARPARHESATVLFTDFSGFTQVASTMPADRMVAELNDVFAAFDVICDDCGVEKIKTIGDAYMAAAGLPKPCSDHGHRCVRAGLRMVAYLDQRNAHSAFKWSLRVGIHSGPVVAGVVGKRKYAYDIWGDTVNIASRMESAGEPGRVNVSAYTYDLIRNEFDCEYRGKVDAKGKGQIDMYFVTGQCDKISTDDRI